MTRDILEEIRNRPSHWCPHCNHPYTEEQINEAFVSHDYNNNFEFDCFNTLCEKMIEVTVEAIPQFSLEKPS